jgi:hypothetical protein
VAGQLFDATAGAAAGALLLGLAFGGLQLVIPWPSLGWLLVLALLSGSSAGCSVCAGIVWIIVRRAGPAAVPGQQPVSVNHQAQRSSVASPVFSSGSGDWTARLT